MVFWKLLLLVREEQQCHLSQQYCEGEIAHCRAAFHISNLLFEVCSADSREKGTTVSEVDYRSDLAWHLLSCWSSRGAAYPQCP